MNRDNYSIFYKLTNIQCKEEGCGKKHRHYINKSASIFKKTFTVKRRTHRRRKGGRKEIIRINSKFPQNVFDANTCNNLDFIKTLKLIYDDEKDINEKSPLQLLIRFTPPPVESTKRPWTQKTHKHVSEPVFITIECTSTDELDSDLIMETIFDRYQIDSINQDDTIYDTTRVYLTRVKSNDPAASAAFTAAAATAAADVHEDLPPPPPIDDDDYIENDVHEDLPQSIDDDDYMEKGVTSRTPTTEETQFFNELEIMFNKQLKQSINKNENKCSRQLNLLNNNGDGVYSYTINSNVPAVVDNSTDVVTPITNLEQSSELLQEYKYWFWFINLKQISKYSGHFKYQYGSSSDMIPNTAAIYNKKSEYLGKLSEVETNPREDLFTYSSLQEIQRMTQYENTKLTHSSHPVRTPTTTHLPEHAVAPETLSVTEHLARMRSKQATPQATQRAVPKKKINTGATSSIQERIWLFNKKKKGGTLHNRHPNHSSPRSRRRHHRRHRRPRYRTPTTQRQPSTLSRRRRRRGGRRGGRNKATRSK